MMLCSATPLSCCLRIGSGDTQWSHERCLLNWIVRKQVESERNGERLDGTFDDDDQDTEPAVDRPTAETTDSRGRLGSRRGSEAAANAPDRQTGEPSAREADNRPTNAPPLRRGRRDESLGRRLNQMLFGGSTSARERKAVKCPQCGTPYHVELGKRTVPVALWMKLYESTGDCKYSENMTTVCSCFA
jgi:hypothetical protein